MNSTVTNQVIGGAGVIAFGVPAAQTCSEGKNAECLAYLSMAGMSAFRLISPSTFTSAATAAKVQNVDKVTNVYQAIPACWPQFALGKAMDQNCQMALQFAGMSFAGGGKVGGPSIETEGAYARLISLEAQAETMRTAPSSDPARATLIEQLERAYFDVAHLEANVDAVPLPTGDRAKWLTIEHEIFAAKQELTQARTGANVDAIDAATARVLEAGGELIRYKAAISEPLTVWERLTGQRNKAPAEFTKLEELQKKLEEVSIGVKNEANETVYGATMEEIAVIKQTWQHYKA